MNALTITFRTITPLFLGGSDPRERAELRIPPIKSAIRYWYRAWVGRYLDLAYMRKQEALHLGLTDGQSSLLIQFDGYDRVNLHQSSKPLPFVTGPAQRPSFNEGEEFTLKFLSRSALDWLNLPLALWLHCSGLGGRARRGAGVLNSDRIPFPDLQAADESWRAQLGVGIRRLTAPSNWPIFQKQTSNILEFKTTASNALGALGGAERVYKTYRGKLSPPDQNCLGAAGPRVASPIHFRPFRGNDAWWVRITVFKSRWAEQPYNEAKQLKVLDGLIKAFIAQGANEVMLP